jgi:GNAT superfamily N-acetyltransferase
MNSFYIERVTKNSFQKFFSLLCDLSQYEHIAPPDDDAEKRLELDLLDPNPKFEAYVGFLNDVPIGFVTFFFSYSTFLARPTLFLEDIFVLEPYRGHGYGKLLFDFCRKQAQTKECGRMDWMVLTWNEPSIKFYEQIGGKRLGWYTYRLEKDQL